MVRDGILKTRGELTSQLSQVPSSFAVYSCCDSLTDVLRTAVYLYNCGGKMICAASSQVAKNLMQPLFLHNITATATVTVAITHNI